MFSSSAGTQELCRWVSWVLFQEDDAVQCSGIKAKSQELCTRKLGGLLAATVTTPALSCMSANRTGQVAQRA